MFIFISSRESILSCIYLLIWLVINVQIVYCIVNYGVVLLPGVVSLMSTTRENLIKGEIRRKNSVEFSLHIRPGNNGILCRITSSQSRVNILYFFVDFSINFYLFSYLVIYPWFFNIECCLVNYAVVLQLVVVSSMAWSIKGVPMSPRYGGYQTAHQTATPPPYCTTTYATTSYYTEVALLALQLHHHGSRLLHHNLCCSKLLHRSPEVLFLPEVHKTQPKR
jgi:hypothetical protein